VKSIDELHGIGVVRDNSALLIFCTIFWNYHHGN